MRKIFLRLRAKTKVNLKPEFKMKVVWNTCEKKFGGMKSINKNYYKSSLKFSNGKSLPEKAMQATQFIAFIYLFNLFIADVKNTVKNISISTTVALNTWLIQVNF